MTRMIVNPLWKRSTDITPDDLEFMIESDKQKPNLIIRLRRFLSVEQIGGYEAYLSDMPYEYGVGSMPDDAIEDLETRLIDAGYDQSVIDRLKTSEVKRAS